MGIEMWMLFGNHVNDTRLDFPGSRSALAIIRLIMSSASLHENGIRECDNLGTAFRGRTGEEGSLMAVMLAQTSVHFRNFS